ncbi:MAG: BMP family ABC transporter substrate-binding protein [Lachnospiraceae bacterium]|nr:BMP family ABC transporter substrate-binding protein [Lachnospiraceae bacterium]MBP3610981.1 BMP family ABC transporter substrate-binding protein [Lachnospiraceae bacterium]
MKKIVITAAIILAVIIVGIFYISGREEKKESLKVGIVLNGQVDDQSWSQSHYEGICRTVQELGLELVYEEAVPESEECVARMEAMIAEGCNIIICNSFNYGTYIQEAAEEHPEVHFFHASGVEEKENLSTYFGRMYQMRYLSGIVAGLQTETNQIGYVAAFPISEVNRGINAFTLGVHSVNPEAVVYVEWCNSWTDDKEAGEATRTLITNYDIDVLAMHTDSLRPLEIAEEEGIWSIGYNMDNSRRCDDFFLTAPVWNWENFYTPRIKEVQQGKFVGRNYWEGAESGMISLAPLTEHVKEGIAVIVEEKMQEISSGTFDVFYGPIYDRNGTLRIPAGESMSDEAMLNEFDWYVEGVKIHGEE